MAGWLRSLPLLTTSSSSFYIFFVSFSCLKGGVGIALGIYGTTVAFVNTHMASKNQAQRRAQFSELVERLGAKLGGRGFGLNEEFHHVIWVGDLNFHVAGVTAVDARTAVKQGRHMELLLHHDELLVDKVCL